MVGRWIYEAIYALGAPWGRGPRPELVELLDSGRISIPPSSRALDIGCGTGDDSILLAKRGFEVVAVDFSRRALREARRRAQEAGVEGRIRFVEGDLTRPGIAGVEGTFDFLFDGGSVDDLQGDAREAAARNVVRWSKPGSWFLMWCFFSPAEDLPLISFWGPSRLGPGFAPGEVERLYGNAFGVERADLPRHRGRWACFLLRRRPLDE